VHLQAFGRTNNDAFFAGYTGIGNDRMNLLGRSDNRVGRTNFKAAGATGAGVFADSGNQQLGLFYVA
jgi:hypothetical protein